MARYITRWLSLGELDDPLREAMLALYLRTYDGSSPQLFLEDLASKDGALLVYAGRELCGFTTVQVYRREWQGRPLQVVYSGDTVVDRAHWGQPVLARDWLAWLGSLKRRQPELPLFWLLLAKGHRTYLYLPLFALSYWPDPQLARSDLKPLADTLARERFPDSYNPVSGVVEFPVSRGHLKPEFASPGTRRSPEVAFFLERNPHYRMGHELVCLCEAEEANLRPRARRAFLGCA